MKGTVKWFDAERGYGFIIGEDEKEIFVHYTEIQSEGFRTLEDGQAVDYEITTTDKGIQACNVKLV